MSAWREIFEKLREDVRCGCYPRGVALPSEAALRRRWGVSRTTAVKALDELVKAGIVYRRRGSGTYATGSSLRDNGRLGLIFPALVFGEIFPKMCRELVRCARADGYNFMLGDMSADSPQGRAEEAERTADSFVEQCVAGVILQPLALFDGSDCVTEKIVAKFDAANIPVVLMDRDLHTPADRMRHDFVAIDNLSAGRELAEHVRSCGAKRIAFLMQPKCAAVIRDRLAGVQSALGAAFPRDGAIVAAPDDIRALAPVFKRRNRPDAVICESDYIAAVLRNTLVKFNLSVPEDVLLAGFNDSRSATAMTPPLTTIRQPCAEMARTAYHVLRERMSDSELPPRRILLPAPLVVRESTAPCVAKRQRCAPRLQ